MNPGQNNAGDASKLNYISEAGVKYYEAMKAARAAGAPLEDYIDSAGMDALRKITAMNGDKPLETPSGANFVPTVTETDDRGRTAGYDIFSLLLKQRIVLVEGEVNDAMASIICASLLYLNSSASGNPKDEIKMHINSPGGSVLAGLAMYDVMRTIEAPITTIGVGMQASMGSILLAAGDTRKMTRSSKLMIHQISGGSRGQATDMALSHDFSERLHEELKNIYVRHIGLKHEFWDLALERDTWLSAEQALKMGFIQEIIVGDRKTTTYDKESIRDEFQKAREAKVPKTADEVVSLLNNISARQGESAAIRAELVTALSQFPEYWTEAKKQEMKVTTAAAAPANQNEPVAAETKPASKKRTAGGPKV